MEKKYIVSYHDGTYDHRSEKMDSREIAEAWVRVNNFYRLYPTIAIFEVMVDELGATLSEFMLEMLKGSDEVYRRREGE